MRLPSVQPGYDVLRQVVGFVFTGGPPPPATTHTKGLCVSWSQRHNPMNYMQMVGPPGLSPIDVR